MVWHRPPSTPPAWFGCPQLGGARKPRDTSGVAGLPVAGSRHSGQPRHHLSRQSRRSRPTCIRPAPLTRRRSTVAWHLRSGLMVGTSGRPAFACGLTAGPGRMEGQVGPRGQPARREARPQAATLSASTKLNDGPTGRRTRRTRRGRRHHGREGPVAGLVQRAGQHLGRGAAALPVAGDRYRQPVQPPRRNPPDRRIRTLCHG